MKLVDLFEAKLYVGQYYSIYRYDLWRSSQDRLIVKVINLYTEHVEVSHSDLSKEMFSKPFFTRNAIPASASEVRRFKTAEKKHNMNFLKGLHDDSEEL